MTPWKSYQTYRRGPTFCRGGAAVTSVRVGIMLRISSIQGWL